MYTDERGTIKDMLVGEKYSITHITFKKGAIRGNHLHKKTIQHDVVLKGVLICKVSDSKGYYKHRYRLKAGECVTHHPKIAHAYQAETDVELLSVCYGVRVGDNYEKDTYRLKKALI